MASAWGNLFSSMGESADRRQQLQREDMIRAQEQADKDRQFKLMMDQFLAAQTQQARGNKLQEAQIASANLTPDAAGSAGSLDANDPRLAAVKGTVYDRSSQGQTLPSSSTFYGPGGDQTKSSKPTGKFVWNPSWEQQQQQQQSQIAQKQFEFDEQRAGREQKTFEDTQSALQGLTPEQRSQRAAGHDPFSKEGLTFEQQMKLVQAGRPQSMDPRIAQMDNALKAMQASWDKITGPTPEQQAEYLPLMKQYLAATGFKAPEAPATPEMPPPPGLDQSSGGGLGSWGPAIQKIIGGNGMDKFLGGNPNLTQGGTVPEDQNRPLTIEELDKKMRELFPNSGNWNPLTMGRDIQKPRR